MGTSNKIQDTNLEITRFKCSQCQQPFTNQDKKNDNWDLWWDISNEVKIDEIWPNDNGFSLSIWVRDITHKQYATGLNNRPLLNCPNVEKCLECSKKSLVSEMKYIDYDKETGEGDEYFCDEECYKNWEKKKSKEF